MEILDLKSKHFQSISFHFLCFHEALIMWKSSGPSDPVEWGFPTWHFDLTSLEELFQEVEAGHGHVSNY